MFMVALGQSKMVKRPVAGILHIIVYAGFVIINIEVIEMIIDGLFGTHRVLSFLGGFYNVLIGSFEVLAVLVLVAVFIFWIRRNTIKLARFASSDIEGAPKNVGSDFNCSAVIFFGLFIGSRIFLGCLLGE
jgi:hypothetical protein